MTKSHQTEIDVAILFALSEEFDHLYERIRDLVSSHKDEETGHYSYTFGYTPKNGKASFRCLTTFMGDMGPVQAALMTERIVRLWNPATIAFVGIGGGLNDDVQLGDVVVATSVDSYIDRAKAVPNRQDTDIPGQPAEAASDSRMSEASEAIHGFSLQMAGECYRTNAALHRAAIHLKYAHNDLYEDWHQSSSEQLERLIPSPKRTELEEKGFIRNKPEIVSGHVASGPIVSAAEGFQSWLKSRDRSLLCIEMESAGFLAAIFDKEMKPATIVVRGISDFGDTRKSELDRIGKGAVRKVAALNAIDLLFRLADADALPRCKEAQAHPVAASDRLDLSLQMSIERCKSRWEALQVPVELSRDLAGDSSIGRLPDALRANIGGVKVVMAPLGSGKTLCAERLYQEAIQNAQADRASPLPVFLDCNSLAGQTLESVARQQTSEIGDPVARGVELIVDELNCLSQHRAIDLIGQARVLSRTWPNTRCHIFSRPRDYHVTQSDLSRLPELSEAESIQLIARVAQEQHHVILSSYTKAIQTTVCRPLFAIMTGVYRRNRGWKSPKSRADLFVSLSELALRNAGTSAPEIHAILRRIASTSLSTGTEVVLKRDVRLSDSQLDAVQVTGLVEVTGDGSGCRFCLPVFIEWFASQAAAHGEVSTDSLIKSQSELERWRMPLAIAIGTHDFDVAFRLLRPIASERPAIAAMIVDDAIASWGVDETIDAPPGEVCAQQLLSAMSLWLPGLGPLASAMTATDASGELRQIAVQTSGPWLHSQWHSGKDTIVYPPIAVQEGSGSDVISATLGDRKSARPGNTPAWALRWTQEECVADINRILKNRRLTTGGAMELESQWVFLRDFAFSQKLFRKGEPLDVKSLRDKALAIRDSCSTGLSADGDICVMVHGKLVRIEDVILTTDSVVGRGATHLQSPWPGPDLEKPFNGWPASQYSAEQLLNRISKIYSAAITEYCRVVEVYFPKFAYRLWTYSILPAKFFAYVGDGDDPLMKSYFWPLPAGAKSEIIVQSTTVVEFNQFDGICEQIFATIASLRPDSASWMSAQASTGRLQIFGETPVSDLVYEWLKTDLSEVHWAS